MKSLRSLSESLLGVHGYRRCMNTHCDRIVRGGAYYCCAACVEADEGGFEIHEHSAGCESRHEERLKEFAHLLHD